MIAKDQMPHNDGSGFFEALHSVQFTKRRSVCLCQRFHAHSISLVTRHKRLSLLMHSP